MAVEKSDNKPAQAADQAKPAKKATKPSTARLSNDQKTVAEAKLWLKDAVSQADGHQLRKRKAPAAAPDAPKAAKKSTKQKAAPKKAKATA